MNKKRGNTSNRGGTTAGRDFRGVNANLCW